MEEIARSRLDLRKNSLKESVTNAQQFLTLARGPGPRPTDTLLKLQLALKSTLKAFQLETDFYTVKGSPVKEVVENAVSLQIRAEGVLLELDSLLAPSVRTQDTVRLPKMDLPSYNGDPLTFTQFWDIFESNVHDKNLADADKFSYLNSCLEGEAKKALEGLSTCNANYTLAITKLRERFGLKHKVIDAHYQALSDLPVARISDCRETLDKIETHLRVLSTLDENTESNQLRTTIKTKFPESILYQVNLKVGNETSVKSIREALDTVISALDNSKQPVGPFATEAVAEVPVVSTAEALHVKVVERVNRKRKLPNRNTPNPKKPRDEAKCVFCLDAYYPDQCTKYKTLEERRSKLKGRCFRCLQTGHSFKNCRAQRKCVHCQGKHNRALCKLKLEKVDTAPDSSGNEVQ